MWVARDKCGELCLYPNKPERKKRVFISQYEWHYLPDTLFPDMVFEDEPIEVEIVKKEKANVLS